MGLERLLILATLIALHGCGVAAHASKTPVARRRAQAAAGHNITSLSVGSRSYHTCAILDGGSIKCWGWNRYGQLGVGDTDDRGSGPNQMGDNLPFIDLAGPAAQVATGIWHTCALLQSGYVQCWGVDRTRTPGPAVNLGTASKPVAISSGDRHNCALMDDGSVKCWGENEAGQLGVGDTTNRGDRVLYQGDALPVVNLGTGRTARQVMAGAAFTCALLDNWSVKCWGANERGQLGQGDNRTRGTAPSEMGDALLPVQLGTNRTARQVSVSLIHACALLDDGSVKCWGANDDGRLGLGDPDTSSTSSRGIMPGQMGDKLPTVQLGTNRTVLQVSLGGHHTCVLLDDHSVKCWGQGTSGRLGIGDFRSRGAAASDMGDQLPTVNLGTGRTVVRLTGADYHNCAHLDDWSVKCWGWNSAGTLGLNDTQDRGGSPSDMGDRLPRVQVTSVSVLRPAFLPPPPPPPPSPIPSPQVVVVPSPAASPDVQPVQTVTGPELQPIPVPTSTSSGSSSSGKGSSFPIGAIIGIIAGVVVLVAVLGLVGWLLVLRRRKRDTGTSPPPAPDPTASTPLTYAPSSDTYGTTPTGWDLLVGSLGMGDVFLRSTAHEYRWIVSSSLGGPLQAVEHGVTDTHVRSHSAQQLTRQQLLTDVRLLSDGFLGRGATAVVFKCVWPSRFGPSSLLAAKIMNVDRGGDHFMGALQSFTYEAGLLARTRHMNVVRLYGYCLEPPTVCLILELLPCSLKELLYRPAHTASVKNSISISMTGGSNPPNYPTFTGSHGAGSSASSVINTAVLDTRGLGDAAATPRQPASPMSLSSTGTSGQQLSFAQVVQISTGIAAGLSYLHDQPADQVLAEQFSQGTTSTTGHRLKESRIVHRDLKPANILMNSLGVPKISDFGLAREHHDSEIVTAQLGVGTLPYMAPELLVAARVGMGVPATNKVDVYSLGMIMCELLLGKPPWSGMAQPAILASVLARRRPQLPGCDIEDQEHMPVQVPSRHSQLHEHVALPQLTSIIMGCWHHRESRRPTASDTHTMLASLLQQLRQPEALRR